MPFLLNGPMKLYIECQKPQGHVLYFSFWSVCVVADPRLVWVISSSGVNKPHGSWVYFGLLPKFLTLFWILLSITGYNYLHFVAFCGSVDLSAPSFVHLGARFLPSKLLLCLNIFVEPFVHLGSSFLPSQFVMSSSFLPFQPQMPTWKKGKNAPKEIPAHAQPPYCAYGSNCRHVLGGSSSHFSGLERWIPTNNANEYCCNRLLLFPFPACLAACQYYFSTGAIRFSNQRRGVPRIRRCTGHHPYA